MNKMPEVAKMLGVELGEWFRVNGNDYCLTSNGLSNAYKIGSPVALNSLLTGACEVRKLPFRPKEDETYYYIQSDGNISSLYNSFGCVDYAFFALGNCFRSKAEAKANKDKILAKFEEIKKEMEG